MAWTLFVQLDCCVYVLGVTDHHALLPIHLGLEVHQTLLLYYLLGLFMERILLKVNKFSG